MRKKNFSPESGWLLTKAFRAALRVRKSHSVPSSSCAMKSSNSNSTSAFLAPQVAAKVVVSDWRSWSSCKQSHVKWAALGTDLELTLEKHVSGNQKVIKFTPRIHATFNNVF